MPAMGERKGGVGAKSVGRHFSKELVIWEMLINSCITDITNPLDFVVTIGPSTMYS